MSLNLFLLKELSAKIGEDSLLIQANGGNTSLKENGVLWIKASGKRLKNALNENIFVGLDLELLKSEIRDNTYNENIPIKNICGSKSKSSIETSLHAQLDQSVVLHTHSIDVIACSMAFESKEYFSESLQGINWNLIPYCRPGLPLAKAIKKAQDLNPSNVLILANHGLVIGEDTIEKAERLQKEVLHRLKQIKRKFLCPDLKKLEDIVQKIPNARLPKDKIIHSLALDSWSYELVRRNSYSPDHVVFCGKDPLIFDKTYQPNRNKVYGIVRGRGVILLEKATPTTEEMLKAQAEIFLRIPPGQKVRFLTDLECDELINWEAEKYRRKLNTLNKVK